MANNVTTRLLHSCSTFRSMPYDQMTSFLKSHNLSLNWLWSGCFVQCSPSLHWCRHCQRPHHTLLHIDLTKRTAKDTKPLSYTTPFYAATGIERNALLITCRVTVKLMVSQWKLENCWLCFLRILHFSATCSESLPALNPSNSTDPRVAGHSHNYST